MKHAALVQSVGLIISVKRKAKGLTQAQVAEMMNIEKETLSRMETGVISPTLSRLAQMAAILECPVSDFFKPYPPTGSDLTETLSQLLHNLSVKEQGIVVNIVADMIKLLKSDSSS